MSSFPSSSNSDSSLDSEIIHKLQERLQQLQIEVVDIEKKKSESEEELKNYTMKYKLRKRS